MARLISASRDAYSHQSTPPRPSTSRATTRRTMLRIFIRARLMQLYVLVFDWQVVDPAVWGGYPGGDLARLDHPLHQRLDERLVLGRRDPLGQPALVGLARHRVALRVDGHAGPGADRAAKARGGQGDAQ